MTQDYNVTFTGEQDFLVGTSFGYTSTPCASFEPNCRKLADRIIDSQDPIKQANLLARLGWCIQPQLLEADYAMFGMDFHENGGDVRIYLELGEKTRDYTKK